MTEMTMFNGQKIVEVLELVIKYHAEMRSSRDREQRLRLRDLYKQRVMPAAAGIGVEVLIGLVLTVEAALYEYSDNRWCIPSDALFEGLEGLTAILEGVAAEKERKALGLMDK